MRMRITGRSASNSDHCKCTGSWSVGADTRTERVVEPDYAGTIYTNSRDVGTILATLCWRYGILGDTLACSSRSLSDDKTADVTVETLCPPDIAFFIEGNQVRSRVAGIFSEILIDVTLT